MEAVLFVTVLAAVVAVLGLKVPRGRYAGRPVSEARLYYTGVAACKAREAARDAFRRLRSVWAQTRADLRKGGMIDLRTR